MTTTIRVLFNGINAEKNAQWFHHNLYNSHFYNSLELEALHQDTVTVQLQEGGFTRQARYIFQLLQQVGNYHFVGPICPNVSEGVDHRKSRRFLVRANHPDYGDEFRCIDCHQRSSIPATNTFVTGKELMTRLTIENYENPQVLKHSPVPLQDVEIVPRTASSRAAALNRTALKSRKMDRHDPSKAIESTSATESEAKALVDAFFKQWPDVKQHFMELELEHTVKHNRELREERDNAHEALKVLHEDIRKLKKELNESDEALSTSNTKLDGKSSERPVIKAADDLLRFLSGLNMQDHSIQEQRDFNSKFHALRRALMENKL